MPSLRKRVSSYFRQLSFHNEPRDRRNNINENSFVTKYLQGHITLKDGPPIIYGKNPTDLPNYELGPYTNGSQTIIGCYSGPNGGLTTVKRTEKHLSMLDDDIDFIDTLDEEIVAVNIPKKSPIRTNPGQPIDNTTMVIKVAGNEYCVTNKPKRHTKSHSLSSIADFKIEIEKTKIDKSLCSNNNNCDSVECKNNLIIENETKCDDGIVKSNPKRVQLKNARHKVEKESSGKENENCNLSKSKSEGNPFGHKKRGKIIKIERPIARGDEQVDSLNVPSMENGDSVLPIEWNTKSEFIYGLSDSLYDRNQVTRNKNGDPIADCFGIIARKDSAILAVADGVNWGEKASIAAKSAVHGSLHYLNKTIFNDLKPFENLTIKTDESSISSATLSMSDEKTNLVSNTREVFVCLLRAFNCAHDLILENKGMLTTLTVAVVLPLKQKVERRTRLSNGEERLQTDTQYICCVCNVGDTLAYVYSRKYGVRELTKGSHDVNSNRDMRDALGALGPVDGINPELSNLTLSITTLQKGDIVMVASDGLTDNFDPNVCKFTVNTKSDHQSSTKTSIRQRALYSQAPLEVKMSATKPVRILETPAQKPPIKPPRKSKTRDITDRTSSERSSIKSSTSPSVENLPNDQHSINNSSIKLEEANRNRNTVLEQNSSNNPANCNSKEAVNSSSNNPQTEYDNPLVAAFMRENSLDDTHQSNIDRTSSERSSIKSSTSPSVENLPNDQHSINNSSIKLEEANRNRNTVLEQNSSNNPANCNSKEAVNSSSNNPQTEYDNPLVAAFMRENSLDDTHQSNIDNKSPPVVENKASSLKRHVSSQTRQESSEPTRSQRSVTPKAPTSKTLQTVQEKSNSPRKIDVGYKFLRSKTTIDMRSSNVKHVVRNEDGVPYVTPIQRYELQLLLMEDILKNGISGKDSPCTSAKKLCENLISYTLSITSAKRHTLEDHDLYFDNKNGVLVEVTNQEKKIRRKKGLERVQNLPGKLDHVTIVAYNVGNFAY